MTRLGHALGPVLCQSRDLEARQGLAPGFIEAKAGIVERPVLAGRQAPSELGAEAVRALALEQEPDWLLCATSTPERLAPPTAASVMLRLGWTKAMAIDVSAGCMGFLTCLGLGQGLLCSGQAKRVVVLACEAMSRILNPEDYRTNVLFGDGAGAALLELGEGPLKLGRGVQYTNPALSDVLQVPGGAARFARNTVEFEQALPYLFMDGKAVFQFATTVLPDVVSEVCEDQDWTLDEVSLLVPHQSNLRILEKAAGVLGFPMEKVAHHLKDHGNLAAASIPVLLSELWKAGKLKPGMRLVLAAYGSGLAYGARAVSVS